MFYCEQLGFERGYRFPDEGPVAFVVVTLGELSLGLTQTQDEPELGRVDLWLYTDDVDLEVDRLRDAGATVLDPPADREWGERMASITDPDGNLLHIGAHGDAVTSGVQDPAAAARRLVEANMYMTLATADESGRPWASPVWFAPRGDEEFLWVSAPETVHSRNIAARPDVAIVIFDSTTPVGAAEALYVEAVAEELSGDTLEQAIATYSQRSQRSGAREWRASDVLPPSRFRLYRATAATHSVLGPGDERIPVRP